MRRPSWTDDPATPSLLVFGGMVLVGFLAIGLGWRVAARTLDVAAQVPALVSGAVGGLALVLIGAVLANVQVGRRLAAQERGELADVIAETTALVDAVNKARS
ncbi:MAG: hypothetical protein JWP14_524 [Frankiales bacterium]|jgi:hypothetical protein|nr:hypothetical protein [Frankiales bacterium]